MSSVNPNLEPPNSGSSYTDPYGAPNSNDPANPSNIPGNKAQAQGSVETNADGSININLSDSIENYSAQKAAVQIVSNFYNQNGLAGLSNLAAAAQAQIDNAAPNEPQLSLATLNNIVALAKGASVDANGNLNLKVNVANPCLTGSFAVAYQANISKIVQLLMELQLAQGKLGLSLANAGVAMAKDSAANTINAANDRATASYVAGAMEAFSGATSIVGGLRSASAAGKMQDPSNPGVGQTTESIKYHNTIQEGQMQRSNMYTQGVSGAAKSAEQIVNGVMGVKAAAQDAQKGIRDAEKQLIDQMMQRLYETMQANNSQLGQVVSQATQIASNNARAGTISA